MACKDVKFQSGDAGDKSCPISQDIADGSGEHVNPQEEMIIKDGKGYINDKYEDCEQFYKPSDRTDVASLIARKEDWSDKEMYGKWMAFINFEEINHTWKEVVHAMMESRLGNCWVAKCSTVYYNPTRTGAGPCTTGVVTVHTSEEDIKVVADQFIHIVKQDIQYNLNQSTLNDGRKSHKVKQNKLHYNYNEGRPTYTKPKVTYQDLKPRYGDIWNVNEVLNRDNHRDDGEVGHWILTLETEELTKFWHQIKQKIMDGNIKAFRMECPKKKKKYSKTEKPAFHVYAMEDKLESVGKDLICIVCRDIQLVRDDGLPPIIMNWNEGQIDDDQDTY